MIVQEAWSKPDATKLLGVLKGWVGSTEATAQQKLLLELLRERTHIEEAPPLEAHQIESLSSEQRETAVRLLIALSCFRSSVADEDLLKLKRINKLLKSPLPWVQTLAYGKAGRTTLASMAIARKSPDAVSLMRQVWKRDGLFGVLKAMRSTSGKSPLEPKVAARYVALGELPKDTLGYAFFQHMRTRSLKLPGEAGGVPEFGLQHDLMHVVTGFDTDAKGESRLASYFFGAISKNPIKGADPFAFIMVALMTFQLGYKIGPSFVSAEIGVVDPKEMFSCFDVGRKLSFDFLSEWDMQTDLMRPIAEVRQKFGMHADGGMATVTSASPS
jgi:hypothetical protein